MRHTTDRAVLGRLNILCTFFAAGQITSSVWFLVVLLSPRVADRDLTTETEEEELAADNKEVLQLTWNPNGDVLWLGLCGFIMFVSSILASRMIRNVNLIGAIRYLWTILWVFPFMVFFVIGLFDYFRVSEVWIKFWWRDKTMAAFRESFCDPSETANTLCAVPVYANPQNETQWCIDNYQATNCTAIRDAAQKGMERFLLGYYYLNAVWGICFLVLVRSILYLDSPRVPKTIVPHNSLPFPAALVGSKYARKHHFSPPRPKVERVKHTRVPRASDRGLHGLWRPVCIFGQFSAKH
jgi:hypothetical protein